MSEILYLRQAPNLPNTGSAHGVIDTQVGFCAKIRAGGFINIYWFNINICVPMLGVKIVTQVPSTRTRANLKTRKYFHGYKFAMIC